MAYNQLAAVELGILKREAYTFVEMAQQPVGTIDHVTLPGY